MNSEMAYCPGKCEDHFSFSFVCSATRASSRQILLCDIRYNPTFENLRRFLSVALLILYCAYGVSILQHRKYGVRRSY